MNKIYSHQRKGDHKYWSWKTSDGSFETNLRSFAEAYIQLMQHLARIGNNFDILINDKLLGGEKWDNRRSQEVKGAK